MRFHDTLIVAALVSVALTATAEARKRPTIDSPGICMDVEGSYDCDGTICSCCYDEGPDAGCWICPAVPEGECVFDPKYSSASPGRKWKLPFRLRQELMKKPATNAPILKKPLTGPKVKQVD